MTRTSLVIVAGLAVTAAACSIDVRGEEIVVRETRRFPVQGDLELAVTTFDGAVEIASWSRPEVLVEIERRAATGAEAESLQVNTTAEGSRLLVDAPAPPGTDDRTIRLGSRQSPSVSLRVTAPAGVTFDARTRDGAIVARDVAGRVSLRSGDGAIRAERIAGALLVDTMDGAVVVRDHRGSLDVRTGDGAVDVSGTLDAVRIDTADGAVRLDVREGSAVTSEWTVQTGDGTIAVRVPRELNADVDAYSGDGRIAITGIATATPSRDDDRPAQVRTSLGRGGSVVRLRTEDGAITVSR